MDHSSNNILVNVDGTPSLPGSLGVPNEGENGDAVAEVQHQTDQEEQMAATPGKDGSFFLPESVLTVLVGLIEKFNLTKEQFLGIYEEYERIKFLKAPEVKTPSIHQQLQVVQEAAALAPNTTPGVPVETNSSDIMDTGEQDLQEEVNKLQSVVQSAIENYHCSPVMTPKRSMNLSDDPLPSAFARELLARDQTLVAQAIRKYLHQYSIPQREVVEKTNINQSHLSQHFTRGVPIKPTKRIKLYHWFEQDQLHRTGKLLTADGSLNAVLESPKVEGYRRRPRWRWSPVATQILSEAFKKNRFPTREQRMELSRICNEAEAAMNNGEPAQGPAGDTEGITEQRINTWFTNRRKGIISDSPGHETFGLTTPSTPGKSPIQQQSKSESSTPTISIPVSLTTPTSSTNSSESVSLTTPLTLSPSQLQSLINQLQVQTPILSQNLSQNLSQILVGHLPQGLTLQSTQGGGASINLEAIIKQVGEVTEGQTEEDEDNTQEAATMGVVEGDEEIITHSVDPSAINSRQN